MPANDVDNPNAKVASAMPTRPVNTTGRRPTISLSPVVSTRATSIPCTDLISFPIGTPRILVRASMRSPSVRRGPTRRTVNQTQPQVKTTYTYDQSTIEPNPFWFGDPQISKKLVDVGKYLLVGDGVDDSNCHEGAKLSFRERRCCRPGVWTVLQGLEGTSFLVSG